ncbi:armadillo-type protein [Phakopsora pachyrhizi]|uniref:Vacuolar protein 8 n=1 Tax=Phakopsora pachyrhizi TaxID=170000 RepID=A0AAV0BGP9_PHAPC|nr:armadillo-type protein [Phakopsora pachyrhizi]
MSIASLAGIKALSTLSFSDNVDLQQSAALAIAEITEKDVREVRRDTLEAIMYLLQSHDTEVQHDASAALGNLAVNTKNKLLIVKLGGLEPLICQMLSPNVKVQCNAVGCIANIAAHDKNKAKIAKSGALMPLTHLARSKDTRVQRKANYVIHVFLGYFILVSLLLSPDTDKPKFIHHLIRLMDSPSLKVQCQAALALINLASDEKYQIKIVKCGVLPHLLNVLITPQNKSPIIEANFLHPLIELLAYDKNEEIQCHAISTLRNLAASSEKNKEAMVKAGVIKQIKELVLSVPLSIQSKMTACAAVLGLSKDIKGQLLDLGILEVLIPLTNSISVEVQRKRAAAIGNLSSKGKEVF